MARQLSRSVSCYIRWYVTHMRLHLYAFITLCILIASTLHVYAVDIPPYKRGYLVCALNINNLLKLNGRQTSNSNLAKSFLRFPKVSIHNAAPLDVVVCDRGGIRGHAMIVLGKGKYLNPSTRSQSWKPVSKVCKRFIAIVRPPSKRK
jgi:hypothetical protein